MLRASHIQLLAVLFFVSLLFAACGSENTPEIVAPTAAPESTPAAISEAANVSEATSSYSEVTPFINVSPVALKDGYEIWNDRPGVAIFDYDRDGDMDFYVTSEGGHSNWLYRNDGDGTFSDVAQQAGVALTENHSTGAAACDFNNDGYQDLYVGAWGDPDDGLDFRSPSDGQGNDDHLFLNNKNGTFQDITLSAFGDAVNLRSATSIACADIDNDGWLDIYVGNLGAQDFRTLDSPNHPGHYNALYRNNGDLTFDEIGEQAGVRGPQITMLDPEGKPVVFEDPDTGETYEGYDPTTVDNKGNRVGDPTGQTHAVMFFDYDDDRDPDLWVANDGDRLRLFRNDSTPGNIMFARVAHDMGIDQVGSWMGFAVGDYDGDADLDVFVTNAGYHMRTAPPKSDPRGTCDYFDPHPWGTCLNTLLRNGGSGVHKFEDAASSTTVQPSPWMPPSSLEPSNIWDGFDAPSGLGAYDFGFGATFFDYDNDGVQDLYWLGSIARGEGPGGQVFPSAGRMLHGDGHGAFEDITVEARLLDISRVNYDGLQDEPMPPDPVMLQLRRISPKYHENGKGVAHGDLNGDGYVDLIGTNSSGELFTESPESRSEPTLQSKPAPAPVFVWMNGGGQNHWVNLRLQGRMGIDGTGSNADGTGARVYVTTGDKVQVQEVRAGSSYLSMDSSDLEFGLGSATVVDKIEIFWPSGRTQALENVSVDKVMVVTEPSDDSL